MIELPGIAEIWAARRRIASHIHKTPLLSSRSLGAARSARLWLKAENLQRAGAFKIRGALHALLRCEERGELGPAGVLTYSSGNHGQAVALAATIVGCRASVVVPRDVARVKRAAIEAHGASVVECGLTSEERREGAERLAAETGAAIIPPYDHPDVIAGQGTIALEVLEDLPDVDAILVPVGGGGLISGIAIGVKALRPTVRIVGVEPATANDMALSLAARRKVRIPPSSTIADGLRAVTPGDLTFEAALRFVDDVWCVEDDAIRRAQRALLERAKLLAEPSGAAALAAFAEAGSGLEGKTVVVIVSGGNADSSDAAALS
ncbi:MAG TPA: threonine/serine dehydratase [Planctomycetota bacterium]|nr:threonine/serine dehydratase [Planctomycetota bacterium]